jgi:hypothetical protein
MTGGHPAFQGAKPVAPYMVGLPIGMFYHNFFSSLHLLLTS